MKRSFGARTVAYPLPVFVIGTYDRSGRPNAMTASWGGICSSDPPSIAVSVRPSRYTYRNLMEKREFTISIPSADYVSEADFFGIASGETTDKFAATGLTPIKAENVNAPYVGEFPVVLECRVSAVTEIGAHTQFIGTILDLLIDESVLDPEGKPDRSKLRPFAYDPLQMEYFTAITGAGKAFSSGKKFMR